MKSWFKVTGLNPRFWLGVAVLAALLYAILFNLEEWKRESKPLVRADAVGYYSYLPALFIYQDTGFAFYDSIARSRFPGYNAPFVGRMPDGKSVNKYFTGESLMLMPGFLVAHAIISIVAPAEAYGYSFGYSIAGLITLYIYLWLGLLALFKILRDMKVPSWLALFAVLIGWFGTNLWFYTSYDPIYSHAWSFSVVCWFIYAVRKFTELGRRQHLYLLCASIAVIIILRPVNALVLLFIPWILVDKNAGLFFRRLARTSLRSALLAVLIVTAVFSYQLFLTYWQTGSFLTYTYQQEGFDFSNPQIGYYLIGLRKGWFVYTPAAAIMILLSVFALKWRSLLLLLPLFAVVYVMSSWWIPSYGMCLGQRPMVEYLPMLILGMGVFFASTTSTLAAGFAIVSLLAAGAVSLVFDYQYRHFIINRDSNAPKVLGRVFLRVSQRYHLIGERITEPIIAADSMMTSDSVIKIQTDTLGAQWLANDNDYSKWRFHFTGSDRPVEFMARLEFSGRSTLAQAVLHADSAEVLFSGTTTHFVKWDDDSEKKVLFARYADSAALSRAERLAIDLVPGGDRGLKIHKAEIFLGYHRKLTK